MFKTEILIFFCIEHAKSKTELNAYQDKVQIVLHSGGQNSHQKRSKVYTQFNVILISRING